MEQSEQRGRGSEPGEGETLRAKISEQARRREATNQEKVP